MPATKTRPTDLAARLEDAETTAAQLRQALAEEETNRQEEERAARAKRQAADLDWWTQRRATYAERTRGRVDGAWKAFAAAVRDGGDTVSAWREWRTTARLVREERLAITAYFQGRENDHARAEVEAYRQVHGEGYTLSQLQVGRDITAGEYASRLAAYNAAATRWQGETFKPDAPPAPHLLRQPARPVEGQVSELAEGEAWERGMLPYSDALESVMVDLDRRAVALAKAERQAARDAHAAKVSA